MKDALTLYGETYWESPYVFTAFVALREKGLPFEVELLDLDRDEQHAAPFRDQSLTARVPSLRHGDFWISESTAIVEYLEEAFPDRQRLLPKPPRDRARARQLMAWIRSDLLALREERPTTSMFFKPRHDPLTSAGTAAVEKLLRVAEQIIPTQRQQLFEEWSIADADLAFMLHRLILNGHKVPPRIVDYAKLHWQRPTVQEFVNHPRPPLE